MIPCHFKTIVSLLQGPIFKKIPWYPIKNLLFLILMSWKIKKGKMSHCELMDFPFKSSMTSSEVERRSFNCNWLCTLASNGLQMAIEVFFLEAAEAVVVASPKSLAASTTRWWKTRQDSPISGQAVRFSTNSKTCQMAVIYYFQKLVGVVVNVPDKNSNRKEILLPWKIEFKKWKEILLIPKIVFWQIFCMKGVRFSFWFSH